MAGFRVVPTAEATVSVQPGKRRPRKTSSTKKVASKPNKTSSTSSSKVSGKAPASKASTTRAAKKAPSKATRTGVVARASARFRPASPLHVDPAAPDVDGVALVRAEQCIALLQRRLIKPISRGGPRGEMSLTQYHALSCLAARGQASVSELKDILGFAQSTTSVLVDKLVRLGLVEKQRDRRDHRLTSVVPLPKGLRLVQRFRKNAERNLLALSHVLGESAVREVFDALERALVATAPLEDPRITRLVADDDARADGDDDDDDDSIDVDDEFANDDDNTLEAAE